MNEQQKKIFIIVGAVAGFLVLFGIVYGVLSSAVFSAKSVANSYVAAISSGNYDKANTIAGSSREYEPARTADQQGHPRARTRASPTRASRVDLQ